MKYIDYEDVLSSARLGRFLKACSNKQDKALELYRLNIILSQNFYAILSMYEVALRNAIDKHYSIVFNDKEWLKNQCLGNGFLNDNKFQVGRFKSKKKVDASIRELGIRYTHDRVIASLSFGFWVNLFAPLQFRLAGQNLHKTFVSREKGTTPKEIYNELHKILDFRNRVAHHEPICFNGKEHVDLSHVLFIYSLILKYIKWLGLDTNKFLKDIDNTKAIVEKINLKYS